MADLPSEPVTRREQFLNAVATGNVDDLPNPITREEMYLDFIAENASSKEGVTPAQVRSIIAEQTDDALSDISVNPVQNKVINSALSDKVDKVSGKGLSSNDYTTSEKTKLANLAEVASSGDYTDLTNKPASLPANGGNADTVDGYHRNQFLQYKNLGIWVGETQDANTILGQGIFDSTNWTNTPKSSTNGALLNINLTGNNIDAENSSGVQLFFRHATPKIWIRYNYGLNQPIGDWKEIFTTDSCPVEITGVDGDATGNGYARFPNSLVIQWGWKNNAASGDTFTFPYTFSAHPSVALNRGKVSEFHKASFKYLRDTDDTTDSYLVHWIAIGYIS